MGFIIFMVDYEGWSTRLGLHYTLYFTLREGDTEATVTIEVKVFSVTVTASNKMTMAVTVKVRSTN